MGNFLWHLPGALKYLQSNHEHWWPNEAEAKSAWKEEGNEWAAKGRDNSVKNNRTSAFIAVQSCFQYLPLYPILYHPGAVRLSKNMKRNKIFLVVCRNYNNFLKSLKGIWCYLWLGNKVCVCLCGWERIASKRWLNWIANLVFSKCF